MAAAAPAAPDKRELARMLHQPCTCCGRRASLEEIAQALGVSRQRVHQLLKERQA
jgi:DNA-directed RNA polymerase sigma subunit (sigma70/sigma32)